MTRWLCVCILLATTLVASAQQTTVQRAAKGPADKDIRIGVYINVRPNCTSGELPSVKLVAAPAHGKITFKKAKINATDYKQCLALEVPGWVGFYRSQPGFAGEDTFSILVTFPVGGRSEVQQFKVMVGASSGQPI
jgi:hypothetical protein